MSCRGPCDVVLGLSIVPLFEEDMIVIFSQFVWLL
jgi:hypothetical protein